MGIDREGKVVFIIALSEIRDVYRSLLRESVSVMLYYGSIVYFVLDFFPMTCCADWTRDARDYTDLFILSLNESS